MRRRSGASVARFAPLAAALALLAACGSTPSAGTGTAATDSLLERYRARRGLPSVAAAVFVDGALVYEAARGTRRAGESVPVSVRDPYHIGSNTKAMSALLAGMLVDEGKLRWEATVADLLGPQAAGAYASARLDELLSHTAGVPEMPPLAEWFGFFATGRPAGEERDRLVGVCLGLKPLWKPGAAFRYSNFGYVVAGRMIEVAAGKRWEELVRERLFAPLGMEDAGFGPPAGPGVEPPDAPWGHAPRPVDPALANADNPPALGPAGTVHASLRDMERYLGLYLRAGTDAQGRRLVSEASLEEIYRPRLAGYALGWNVHAPGGVRRLEHAGSNTTFTCQLIVVPSRGCAVVVMTNRGDAPARRAAADLARDLAGLHGF